MAGPAPPCNARLQRWQQQLTRPDAALIPSDLPTPDAQPRSDESKGYESTPTDQDTCECRAGLVPGTDGCIEPPDCPIPGCTTCNAQTPTNCDVCDAAAGWGPDGTVCACNQPGWAPNGQGECVRIPVPGQCAIEGCTEVRMEKAGACVYVSVVMWAPA